MEDTIMARGRQALSDLATLYGVPGGIGFTTGLENCALSLLCVAFVFVCSLAGCQNMKPDSHSTDVTLKIAFPKVGAAFASVLVFVCVYREIKTLVRRRVRELADAFYRTSCSWRCVCVIYCRNAPRQLGNDFRPARTCHRVK